MTDAITLVHISKTFYAAEDHGLSIRGAWRPSHTICLFHTVPSMFVNIHQNASINLYCAIYRFRAYAMQCHWGAWMVMAPTKIVPL